MPNLTRRSIIKLGLSAAGLRSTVLRAAQTSQPASAPACPFDFALPIAGTVKPVAPSAIAASSLSVGYETLDRRHFDPARTYPHLAQLGVKWARCQTGWCRCETTKGIYDFAWLDEVVNALLALGVQPWFNLGYGNRLYTPDAPDEFAVGWAPIFSNPARQSWLRFVNRIAEHFRDRVQHWEIWNEPNSTGFWRPEKPDAAAYVELVRITAPEIRRHVPNAVLIGGAFAGIPMSYIQRCLDAGLADQVDKISYHPYRSVPETNYEKEIAELRDMIARHKKGIPIWQGENGCPSQGGPGSAGALRDLEWDQIRQAKWLLRRILCDLRLEIELTSYYHMVDLVGYRGMTNYKGLLQGTDYIPKLSYRAYQCLCALFDSRTAHKPDLSLRLIDQEKVHLYDAGFVRTGRAVYAYWYPTDLQKGWTPRRITVQIDTPSSATIADPVLIDSLTARVFRLKPSAKSSDNLTLENLPLLDYPLLIADAGVALRTS
jgi:polysaccharide biosynthesis protein PslG